MATPPSDDTRMLFRLLSDNLWHSYEEIRDKLAATVPPGRALRKYEERVEYARKYKGDPGYDTTASESTRIFLGARACAQIVITSWKGRGIQQQGSATNKQIRVKPGFTSWGLEHEGVPIPGSGDSGGAETPAEPPDEASESEPVVELTPEQDAALEAVYDAAMRRVHGEDDTPAEEPVIDLGFMSLPPIVVDVPVVADGETSPSVVEPEVVEETVPVSVKPAVPTPSEPTPQRNEMALFSESEIRHLMQEEIAKALDAFQAGMRLYLDEQFEQLRLDVTAKPQPAGRWYFDPHSG